MHKFLDNFHQSEKFSSQISSHQAELRREENFSDQNYLSISSLQNDYLHIYSSSDCGKNSERENIVQTKCSFCRAAKHSAEKCFERIRKEREKYSAAGDSDNKRMECTPQKCFICESKDHIISKCPKPSKEN